MLQSTENLIVETHEFFYEIGYRPRKGMIRSSRVREQVELTVMHAKKLGDALCVLRLYIDYLGNESSIKKTCAKFPDFWDSLGWDGKRVVHRVSDKDALGSYYLTNVFDLDKNAVTVLSQSFGNTSYLSEKKNGFFQIADYYLGFSGWTNSEMVIENENDEILTKISYEAGGRLVLKDNCTKYEVVTYEGGIGIYKASYINSLGSREPNLKRCIGFIEWDILDDDGDYGLSRLDVYDTKVDLELMFAIASSCFLVFKNAIGKMEREGMRRARFPMLWAYMANRRR